jgi:hypothetical protein
LKEINSEVVHASKSKSLYLRLPILIYFVYLLFSHLNGLNYGNIIYPFSIATYELGHFACFWMGVFIAVLGGMIFQLGLPIVAILTFYFRGDFFAMCFSFGWLSISLFVLVRFVIEARAIGMPLIGPFSERNILGDWYYFLTQAGLLPYTKFISFALKASAFLAMFICLAGGFWLLILAKKNSLGAKR